MTPFSYLKISFRARIYVKSVQCVFEAQPFFRWTNRRLIEKNNAFFVSSLPKGFLSVASISTNSIFQDEVQTYKS